MNNFQFHNPVKILFGKGELTNFKGEIPAGAHVMMLYGQGSIKKNGVYDKVKSQLSDFEITEFGGIEANPRYETLMAAVEIIRAKKIDFLLAVGGGSVLDGTKFIALAVHYKNGDPWNILSKQDLAGISNPLPIGSVLTLPATGSEMNGNFVISRISTKEKLANGTPLVLPQFSVLDPGVIVSLPQRQIANGIVDTFVHVMEQYLTYPVNAPIQDGLAETILKTLIEEGPKVLKDSSDYDAAANFMWSATMALNGLISAGVPQDWSTHIIGHEITALYGIDHARTLAIVYPGVLKVMLNNKKDKLLQYGANVWAVSDGSADERAPIIIEKTLQFFESLGIKTHFSDYEVGAEVVDEVGRRLSERGVLSIGEKADMTGAIIRDVLNTQL